MGHCAKLLLVHGRVRVDCGEGGERGRERVRGREGGRERERGGGGIIHYSPNYIPHVLMLEYKCLF